MTFPFKIKSLQAFCYRYPLATPVVTSFGRMNDRPAVFVRVDDEDGEHGWGEVWCNFPAVGAEHRTRLINEMLAPMLIGRAAIHPSELFDSVTAATSVLALQQAPPLEEFGPAWLEEPLRADRPWSEWRTLCDRLSIPLAGGENIAGGEAFAAALAEGVLNVIQPDVAKWGGITGCIAVAREVAASNRVYCPHYLGGGIGLLASAHLLAACNGGFLEVDSNDNPLRENFCGMVAAIKDGEIELPETPGLGIAPDLA